MTATGRLLTTLAERHPQMRPIHFPGDLHEVANLVELCFEATLDADGKRFIRQMRRAASQGRTYPGTWGLLGTVKGYVWEEAGHIVGNINLIPVRMLQTRAYLIANVAVHPDFRRRGIANALTKAALAFAETRNIRQTALQVDIRNLAAQTLYLSYGFEEKARRTVWHQEGSVEIKLPSSVKVGPRRREDWLYQRDWLDRYYDQHVRWNLPIGRFVYAPGLVGWLLRITHEHQIRQWSAVHHGEWIGSLTWQSSYNQADWLWLAAPPDKLDLATCALIPFARRDLLVRGLIKPGRLLALNFPAGKNAQAFETVGFKEHNTLIWMEKGLG
jgi:ribosomal protein S18 acetylase RimI-like enzyme